MQAAATYASLLSQITAMTTTSALSQKLSNQLSNGVKAVDLADNADHGQILDLTTSKAKRTNYAKSCTTAAVTTSSYSDSLTSLMTLAKNALGSVQTAKTSYTGISSAGGATSQSATDALQAFTTLGTTVTQYMQEASIDLNEQTADGNGYLYSGLRTPTSVSTPSYTTPTVVDLTQLPYFLGATSPAPNPAGTTIAGYTPPTNAVDTTTTAVGGANADLPTYDADFSASRPAASAALLNLAYGTQKVTIDDNQTVNVGISSTASAFQDLVNGLRAAKTAADQAGNYSTADRDQFMTLAYSSLTKAVTGLQALQNQNSLTDATVQGKNTQHEDWLSLITNRLDSLNAIDTTTVTASLAAANNQLTASYKATASLLSLSLVSYLK